MREETLSYVMTLGCSSHRLKREVVERVPVMERNMVLAMSLLKITGIVHKIHTFTDTWNVKNISD